MATVYYFANILIWILLIAIFLQAMLSWFPSIDQRSFLVRVLNEITAPILNPLGKIVPRVGMIDVTPMVAMLVLFVIQVGLQQLMGA